MQDLYDVRSHRLGELILGLVLTASFLFPCLLRSLYHDLAKGKDMAFLHNAIHLHYDPRAR